VAPAVQSHPPASRAQHAAAGTRNDIRETPNQWPRLRGLDTLAYYGFPEEHWRRIRTNNPLERILREIRRRTRVVGPFPDGESALNLAAARLRHIAGSEWSAKRYLSMELLREHHGTTVTA
jgi:transposase-like protein